MDSLPSTPVLPMSAPNLSPSLNANGPLRGRFAALEGLVAWLETEVNTLNESQSQKINELQRELQKSSPQMKILEQQNLYLKHEISSNQSELQGLKSELSQLNHEIAFLNKRLTSKDIELGEAADLRHKLESEIESLKIGMSGSSEAMASCQQEISDLKAERESLRSENALLKRDMGALQQQLDSRNLTQIECNRLKEEVKCIPRLREELDQSRKERATALADVQAEVTRVREESSRYIDTLNAEIAEVKGALNHTLVSRFSGDLKNGGGLRLGQSLSVVLGRLESHLEKVGRAAASQPRGLSCQSSLGAMLLSWEPTADPEDPTVKPTEEAHQEVKQRACEYIIFRGEEPARAAAAWAGGERPGVRWSEVLRVPGDRTRARVDCWELTGTAVHFRVAAVLSTGTGGGLCVEEWSALSSPVYAPLPKRVRLQFSAPFDEQGLFYHLGSGGGRRAYSNPHSAGLVVATLSSAATDPSYSQAHKFVGRINDGYCCTDNRQGSYMSVDIGAQRRLRVNHYCLKNDGLGMYHALRNWELQGRASEEDEWMILRRHVGDTSLANTAYAVDAWPVEGVAAPLRFFRIFQFDANSYGANNIMCCGMELYGDLFTTVVDEGLQTATALPNKALK